LAVIERDIDLAWVGQTLAAPEKVEPDRTDPSLRAALRRIPERDGRVLRVVDNDSVIPRRVVTLLFDRRLRNQL
jgi:hypothetical protein